MPSTKSTGRQRETPADGVCDSAGEAPAVQSSAFVYVLGAASGGKRITYVGWCVDLEKRLAAHNAGRGARSTRGRAWALLYAERFGTRNEAMSREVYLKRDRAFRAALAALLQE